MLQLSPNAEKLLIYLRKLYKEGKTELEKKELQKESNSFSDQAFYELAKHQLIIEDNTKIILK